MDDADLDYAVEGCAVGRVRHDGTALHGRRRVRSFTKRSTKKFCRTLVDRAKALRVGNGARSDRRGRPGHQRGRRREDHELHRDRPERGRRHARLRRQAPDRRRATRTAIFIEPTVFTDVTPEMRIAQEEIFGPVMSVIPVRVARRGDRDRQRRRIRPVGGDLHAGRQPRLPRDARPLHRHLLCERADDRRRSPPAVRRHKGTGNGHREAGTRCSTCFQSGSRSTSTSAASCSARRSIRKI